MLIGNENVVSDSNLTRLLDCSKMWRRIPETGYPLNGLPVLKPSATKQIQSALNAKSLLFDAKDSAILGIPFDGRTNSDLDEEQPPVKKRKSGFENNADNSYLEYEEQQEQGDDVELDMVCKDEKRSVDHCRFPSSRMK